MDIAGAKALKERLGLNGTEKAPPAAEDAEIPVDAPPVYHWTGVSKAPPADVDSEPTAPAASLFRRLGLSLR